MDKTGPFTDSQLILWRMAVVAFAAKEGSQVNWWGREANTVLRCMIHHPYPYRDDCSSPVTCSNTIEGILRLGYSDRSRQENKDNKETNTAPVRAEKLGPWGSGRFFSVFGRAGIDHGTLVS